MVLQYEDDNPLLPKFTCSESLKDELIQHWKDALITKPLGRHVGAAPFERRVRELWKPRGEMTIMVLGFGYFLIKFDNDEDRERVLLEGLWTVQGHYLTVQQ